MKTVLYFDYIRNRRKLLWYILIPLLVLVVMFTSCGIVDKVFPTFNATYMKWPDLVKNLIGLANWSGSLAINVWQLFAMLYPFCMGYVIMKGLCHSLLEEERLETVVYIRNTDIGRKQYLLTKGVIWLAFGLLVTIGIMIVTVLLALLVGAGRNVPLLVEYYVKMFFVLAFYIGVAYFLVVSRQDEEECEERIMEWMVFPWLVSRIPAVLQMLSVVMVMTGREGAIADKLAMLGERMHSLLLVCPFVWCQTAVDVPWQYVLCLVCVWIVLVLSAFSVDKKRMQSIEFETE